MDSHIKEQILGQYKKEVLQSAVSDPSLYGKLLTGLEKVLDGVNVLNREKNRPLDLLNLTIDYDDIKKQACARYSIGVATRIETALDSMNIHTYGDLARAYLNYVEFKKTVGYHKFLRTIKKMGDCCQEIFEKHLKSIGFDFSIEYAQKAANYSGLTRADNVSAALCQQCNLVELLTKKHRNRRGSTFVHNESGVTRVMNVLKAYTKEKPKSQRGIPTEDIVVSDKEALELYQMVRPKTGIRRVKVKGLSSTIHFLAEYLRLKGLIE